MIDVLLAADTFRDSFADDDSFQLMALGIFALRPTAMILVTRIKFGKQHSGRSGVPRTMELEQTVMCLAASDSAQRTAA